MKTTNEKRDAVIAAAEKVVKAMRKDLFLGSNDERKLTEADADKIAEGLMILLPTVLGMDRAGEFAKNGVALRKAGEELAAALHSLHDERG
jgi:hypothetical protein